MDKGGSQEESELQKHQSKVVGPGAWPLVLPGPTVP